MRRWWFLIFEWTLSAVDVAEHVTNVLSERVFVQTRRLCLVPPSAAGMLTMEGSLGLIKRPVGPFSALIHPNYVQQCALVPHGLFHPPRKFSRDDFSCDSLDASTHFEDYAGAPPSINSFARFCISLSHQLLMSFPQQSESRGSLRVTARDNFNAGNSALNKLGRQDYT
jgi:hypothetical protein